MNPSIKYMYFTYVSGYTLRNLCHVLVITVGEGKIHQRGQLDHSLNLTVLLTVFFVNKKKQCLTDTEIVCSINIAFKSFVILMTM